MNESKRPRVPVGKSEDLAEKEHLVIDLFYEGEPHSAIVFRFEGRLFAYLNRCVHMQKRLDSESEAIFDERNALLRCSMHGILYRPETGESLSPLCPGRSLTALRVKITDGLCYLEHRRISPAPGRQPSTSRAPKGPARF